MHNACNRVGRRQDILANRCGAEAGGCWGRTPEDHHRVVQQHLEAIEQRRRAQPGLWEREERLADELQAR
jgi:hypothetical protein